MPLQFSSATAQILFWVFSSLSLGTALFWGGTVLCGALRLSAFTKPLPMLCFGCALVCLGPHAPVVYLAAFFFSAGELWRAFLKEPTRGLAPKAFSLTGEILLLSASVGLFADFIGIPRSYFCLLIVLFAAAAGGALGAGMKDPEKKNVFYLLSLLYEGFDLLAVALLVGFAAACMIARFYTATIFVLVGACFLAGEKIFSRYFAPKLPDKRRALYPFLPFYIGEIVISFGILLSLALPVAV